jgi:hypothetical protein
LASDLRGGEAVNDGPLTSLRCLQQRRDDLLPLHIERSLGRGAAGPPVPVAGIARVAFHPMQMGVDPGAGAIVLSLGEAVSPVPVATLPCCTEACRAV